MLDMEQSGGIRAKLQSLTLVGYFVLSSIILSGCSAQLDALRPELNSENRLKVDPSTVVADFDDYKQNTDYIGSGPTVSDRWGSVFTNLDDPAIADRIPFWMRPSIYSGVREEQAPVQSSFVVAEDYSAYLEEKVYSKVSALLSTLPTESQAKLYFRVLHVGCSIEGQQLKSAAAYTNSQIGGLTSVSGTAISAFTYDWLTRFSLNNSTVSTLQSATLSKANTFITNNNPPEPFSDWSEVDWLAASETDFPTDLLFMWGNEQLNCQTYIDYIAAVEANPLCAVPNLSLYYYTNSNATSKGTIVLNKISTNSVVSRYISSMDSDTLQKVFTTVNQSTERDAAPVQKIYQDDGAILFSYYDGYNKTLIFLATAPGENLADVLGDVASEEVAVITNAYSVIDCREISALYPGAGIAREGLRGS